MKLFFAAATFAQFAHSVDAFGSFPRLGAGSQWHAVHGKDRLFSTALNAGNVGLYFSSSTGNTEVVAGYIAEANGLRADEIGDANDADVQAHDAIIIGAPTWHTGEDTERSGTSWDEWLYSTLPGLDLKGTKIAVFGVGDQESYCDFYCDAAGELHDCFEAHGCKMGMGYTSTEGYNHAESKAERGGKFIGLMCDEDNQYDLSEDRAKNWVAQLKEEVFF